MSIWRIIVLWLFISPPSMANPLPAPAVPNHLQDWIPWVLHDINDADCPTLYNQDQRTCQWSGQLRLDLHQQGGQFQQFGRVYGKQTISLAGGMGQWPQHLKINGYAVPVISVNGVPSVVVKEQGAYRIQGQWQWQSLPESLIIPDHIALLKVQLEGNLLAFPERDKHGHLWLQSTKNQRKRVENKFNVEVYRQLRDGLPAQLETRLSLEVAGQIREEILPPLWHIADEQQAGWIAMRLDSVLPARLETDGRLRVQVRPGRWQITVVARYSDNLEKLSPLLLDEKEVWVFQDKPPYRLVELQGLDLIDGSQTNLPTDWQTLPAYQLERTSNLTILEKQRGENPDLPAKLSLKRRLWLDFDGQGYTQVDHIVADLPRSLRLELNPPLSLGQVSINDQNQLITDLSPQDTEKESKPESAQAITQGGFEVPQGHHIRIKAASRLDSPHRNLSVSAWNQDFQSVDSSLYLPPGWRLWHVQGAEQVSNTWLAEWTLLDFFLVLLISLAIGKLWHWQWGALSLLCLLLIWQVPEAPQSIWMLLLIGLALFRVLPEDSGLQSWLRRYYHLNLLILILISVLFTVQQVRISLYPQLPNSYNIHPYMMGSATDEFDDHDMENKLDYAPEAEQNEMMAAKPSTAQKLRRKAKRLVTQQLRTLSASDQGIYQKDLFKQQLALEPNTQVQTGPGLPTWQWQQINMSWQGPVSQDQKIDFYLSSPRFNQLLIMLQLGLLILLNLLFINAVMKDQPIWKNWRKTLSLKPTTKQAVG